MKFNFRFATATDKIAEFIRKEWVHECIITDDGKFVLECLDNQYRLWKVCEDATLSGRFILIRDTLNKLPSDFNNVDWNMNAIMFMPKISHQGET